MADREQLVLLRRGVAVWNQWRQDNAEVEPDLMDGNLKGMYLRGVNLSRTHLDHTDLKGSYCLRGNFREIQASRSQFDGAYLKEIQCEAAYLRGATFRGADLRGANFRGADLVGADFRGADLRGADFSGGNLYRAQLMGAIASYTRWNEANLLIANLREADLHGADLWGANLARTHLESANLSEVVAFNTNFEGATLTASCVENMKIDDATNFRRANCQFVYLKADRQMPYPSPSENRFLDEDAIALICQISTKLISERSRTANKV